ncbi:MAG TPA: 23S rRNA (adenine(2503)-C(2))-methyltransferase RlmN [Rectinemataceae bacterium]|nr:23S rRNA (adenine(2503)-C(2))-methyltransferase RlmN [Rectinemataceae bacterium]
MDGRHDILGLDFAELTRLAEELLPGGRGVAGEVYSRAFSSGRLELEGLGLSERNRRAWEEHFFVGLLSAGPREFEEGEFGDTEKAVLLLADGTSIECVLIPMPTRTAGAGLPEGRPKSTLCVSSQVGCRMGCAFCETGRQGLSRNLSAAEIVSQLVTTKALFGWNPGNIVFMGMGEPLDNLDGLKGALAVLTDRRGPAFSWERITVCTSGSAEGLAALRSVGHPRLNLSLSLNAGDDPTRSRIMPVNRKTDLGALATALVAWPRRRNFVLALNYCLLPGINDGADDARGAAEFSQRVGRSIVNLIPYNPGSHPIAPAPSEEEVERFRGLLEAEGCIVKRRAGKGGGIMAACGQLGGSRGDNGGRA